MSNAFYNALCDHQHIEGYEEGYKDGYEAGKRDAAQRWHRVEEPPKEDGAYVVWWNYKGASFWFRGIFFDGRWRFEPGTPKPDYWMPIEPPKEDE